jgi:hypothetical protein
VLAGPGILRERMPDLLAALHLSWCVAREDIIAPVAISPPPTGIAGIADMALPLFKQAGTVPYPVRPGSWDYGENGPQMAHSPARAVGKNDI